jgi:hypothetical protein
MAWDELGSIVASDARFSFELPDGHDVDLVGPAALGEFGRRATASFSFYGYQPLNTVVHTSDAEAAAGRSYSLEVAVDRISGDWLEFYGRYDDEYVLDDHRWCFARRSFRTLARRATPASG